MQTSQEGLICMSDILMYVCESSNKATFSFILLSTNSISNNLLTAPGHYTGIIQGMGSANESRRYNVTSALIGLAHAQNDPCYSYPLPSLISYNPWSTFHTTPESTSLLHS